jgi:hypothetical protein
MRFHLISLLFLSVGFVSTSAQCDETFYQDGFRIVLAQDMTISVYNGETLVTRFDSDSDKDYPFVLSKVAALEAAISAGRKGNPRIYLDKRTNPLSSEDTYIYDGQNLLLKIRSPSRGHASELQTPLNDVAKASQAKSKGASDELAACKESLNEVNQLVSSKNGSVSINRLKQQIENLTQPGTQKNEKSGAAQ